MRILTLLLLLLTVDAMAQNDAGIRLTRNVSTINLSGRSGDSSFILSSDDPNAFLTSLAFFERGDDPCRIDAGFTSYVDGNDSAQETVSSSADSRPSSPGYAYIPMGCGIGNDGRDRGRDRRVISARTSPSGGQGAIHGILVCSNNRNGSNYKLKGARAMVTMINRDGQGDLRRDPQLASTFERTNCREWEQPRRCPVGQVAVGVEVFHTRRNGITGLALQCQQVRVTPL